MVASPSLSPTALRLRRLLPALLAAAGAALPGCSSEEPAATPAPVQPEVRWPTLQCDPLVPEHCGFPFPSNVFTAADGATPTGRRVALSSETLPKSKKGKTTDPTPFNRADGFSAGVAALAFFPGATTEGLPTPQDLDASLGPDSPTIILCADTGERVPHYATLDYTSEDPAKRSLLVRPVLRLRDATRYIVALRGVRGKDGLLPASSAFAALRDGVASPDPSVEDRRGLYEDIFQRLGQAGIARAGLQLAWDFTTASRENNTAWMVHMRDEALAAVGEGGPAFSIDQVETDWSPEHIAYRLFGKMTVPLYLDQPGPGGKLVFGEDGLPEPNAEQPTYEVEFEVLIPRSATKNPGALLQYGHGLLGEKEQIESDHFLSFIDEHDYVFFAVDLAGMESEDEPWIGEAVTSGQEEKLAPMFERLQQGMLNYLLAMRMMSRGFAKDPTYGGFVDPSRRYYHGISQGGIFGATYLALSTDVSRGALCVMGQPYNLLLPHSVDFDPFFALFRGTFADSRDHMLLLSLFQMLWDRTDPSGYTAYMAEDRLPDVPEKQVLMRAALGDHQVTTLGAHVMARAMGAKHVDTGLRDIWGLEKVETADTTKTTAAIVEYDFGLPEEPPCDVPMRVCEDPHGKLRKLEEARTQLAHFLETGEVKSFCQGPCRFADLSGCKGDEPGGAALCGP
ncbi:MAG: hypothetical protein HY744_24785 [Deltaproteobacteria bacterium]|nr:hypothetical protein [Deltaproteobacteria bacterium]